MPKTQVLTSKTETRKADREFMAKAIIDLAKNLNLNCDRVDYPAHREIRLNLAAQSGLRLGVDFSGTSCQPDVHVLSWNQDHATQRKLNDATFGGNVNPHHKQKATYVAYGFEQLLELVTKGFTMAHDGTAYLP